MKAKSLLLSILAAAALLVGCNNDPQEVIVTTEGNPNINGTWIYSGNDNDFIYKLTINGTTLSVEYTGYTRYYDYYSSIFVSYPIQMYRTLENCAIDTYFGSSTISFVYDYSATIYPDNSDNYSTSNKTGYKLYNYNSFSYEVINSCLVIYDSVMTPSINTADYYDSYNTISYTDINAGKTMIPSGVYYRE